MIQSVPKSEFENADTIEPGMQFQVEANEGTMVFTAVEVKDEEIVLDGNHPLAGITLHFDVEIDNIREATKEELDHGNIQGEDEPNH